MQAVEVAVGNLREVPLAHDLVAVLNLYLLQIDKTALVEERHLGILSDDSVDNGKGVGTRTLLDVGIGEREECFILIIRHIGGSYHLSLMERINTEGHVVAAESELLALLIDDYLVLADDSRRKLQALGELQFRAVGRDGSTATLKHREAVVADSQTHNGDDGYRGSP